MPQLPVVEDLGPAEDEGDRTREQVLQHLGAGKEEASRGERQEDRRHQGAGTGEHEAPRGQSRRTKSVSGHLLGNCHFCPLVHIIHLWSSMKCIIIVSVILQESSKTGNSRADLEKDNYSKQT